MKTPQCRISATMKKGRRTTKLNKLDAVQEELLDHGQSRCQRGNVPRCRDCRPRKFIWQEVKSERNGETTMNRLFKLSMASFALAALLFQGAALAFPAK